jgi:hypothetical protein
MAGNGELSTLNVSASARSFGATAPKRSEGGQHSTLNLGRHGPIQPSSIIHNPPSNFPPRPGGILGGFGHNPHEHWAFLRFGKVTPKVTKVTKSHLLQKAGEDLIEIGSCQRSRFNIQHSTFNLGRHGRIQPSSIIHHPPSSFSPPPGGGVFSRAAVTTQCLRAFLHFSSRAAEVFGTVGRVGFDQCLWALARWHDLENAA